MKKATIFVFAMAVSSTSFADECVVDVAKVMDQKLANRLESIQAKNSLALRWTTYNKYGWPIFGPKAPAGATVEVDHHRQTYVFDEPTHWVVTASQATSGRKANFLVSTKITENKVSGSGCDQKIKYTQYLTFIDAQSRNELDSIPVYEKIQRERCGVQVMGQLSTSSDIKGYSASDIEDIIARNAHLCP